MKSIKKINGLRSYSFIAFVFLALIFFSASYYLINRTTAGSIKSFNEEVRVFTSISTRAVVQNFKLYYGSGDIKLKETTEGILSKGNSISKFDVIDIDGRVLYSSDGTGVEEVVSNVAELDAVRSLEASYILQDGKIINTIIYPYIEDWGAHKYSVRYTLSHEELENKLTLYRNEVILVSFLLLLISFFPIISIFTLKDVEFQREDKKRLQDLNKQKDNFMVLIAHNLRTPISIMKGYANLATEKSLSKIEKEYVDAIIEGTNRLSEVTETIIRVNEILSGSELVKKRERLADIVDEVLSEYAGLIKKKKITLSVKFEKGLPEIEINRDHVEKTVKSLVDNAVKFNKEKGEIDIILRREDSSLNFEIKDTGIGIKKEDQKTIFSSFNRAVEDVLNYDYSGLGMGLYLAKVTMEAHNGKIWVKSDPDVGSTFGLSFPING